MNVHVSGIDPASAASLTAVQRVPTHRHTVASISRVALARPPQLPAGGGPAWATARAGPGAGGLRIEA